MLFCIKYKFFFLKKFKLSRQRTQESKVIEKKKKSCCVKIKARRQEEEKEMKFRNIYSCLKKKSPLDGTTEKSPPCNSNALVNRIVYYSKA